MDAEKISIIMPVKNCEIFLEEAIRSMLRQSYDNTEFIIMDNGSSDGSWEIMMDYKQSDNRIRVARNKNIGLTSSLNLMLDLATGGYIARIDADDTSEPDRLRLQRSLLRSDDSAILCAGRCRVVGEDGGLLYEHGPSSDKMKLKWGLLFKNEIWHSSAMWKNGKGFRYDSLYTYAQDYEMWSRMAKSWDIVATDTILGTVRKRADSISTSKSEEQTGFASRISKSNIEKVIGRELPEDTVEKLRMIYEGSGHDPEAEKIYEELSDKFSSADPSVARRRPMRIRIGKKRKDEPEPSLNTDQMEDKITISKKRWRESSKKSEGGRNYIWLERENRYIEVEVKDYEISPAYGASTERSPWEGFCQIKPWNYEVTAVIPCLNTPETLPICIELLRLQTSRPFIMIIDTGSTEKNLRLTEDMRSDDVEVHSIRLNGVRHPSDYPAMAMDLAFSLCRTEYMFATHSDCFLRSRKVLECFLDLCRTKSPVIGYELSPRAHEDWAGMVSHTASMYHMPTMDKIGFGWSLRRLCNRYGIVDYKPDPNKPNWPDTEILGNYILRENNILPHLVGKEGNHCRTLDENIDHFRSYGAAKMYSPEYYPRVSEWYHLAKSEALARIEEWSSRPSPVP